MSSTAAGGVTAGSIMNVSGTKTGNHTTFTRNMGECVPTYWKDYPDCKLFFCSFFFTIDAHLCACILVVRFLVRRSVEMTLARGTGNDPNAQASKCRAMESVILESGKLKSAAVNHGCNYSTLHNCIHRALVTIESVLGRTALPEETRRLIDAETEPEEIARILNVKRAPTQARFVPPSILDADASTSAT